MRLRSSVAQTAENVATSASQSSKGSAALAAASPEGSVSLAAGRSPKGLIGTDFEKWLHTEMNAGGHFKVGKREFDASIGSRWIEAKSGNYWDHHAQPGTRGYGKFQSDAGEHLAIAIKNNATFEIHSSVPIPQHVKEWLAKKGIGFVEH